MKATALNFLVLLLGCVLLSFQSCVVYNIHNSQTNSQTTHSGSAPGTPSGCSPESHERARANNPSVPQRAFGELCGRFPQVQLSGVNWVRLDNIKNCPTRTIWEARFHLDGEGEVDVEFNANNGDLLEVEYEEFPAAKLPKDVKDAFERYRKERNAQPTNDIEMEESPNGTRYYEFELGSRDMDVTFDVNGNRVTNSCED